MATTQNRIDTDNCDALTLYKTLAKIVDALNDKKVKDQYRKPHAVSVFVEQLNITYRATRIKFLEMQMAIPT